MSTGQIVDKKKTPPDEREAFSSEPPLTYADVLVQFNRSASISGGSSGRATNSH
jgi:hypothetical protein